MSITENYSSLRKVLDAAYHQASEGKGAERHGNNGDLPFTEQPMFAISNLLNTDGGLAYQAIKKIVEARGLPTVERQERELLGAINYIAGMVIMLREEAAIDFATAQYESLVTTPPQEYRRSTARLQLLLDKDALTPEVRERLRAEQEAFRKKLSEGGLATMPLLYPRDDQNAPKSTEAVDYPEQETIMMVTAFNDRMVTKAEDGITVYAGGYWELANKYPEMYARRFADVVKTQAMLHPGQTIIGSMVDNEAGYRLDLTDQREYILELLEGCGMFTVSTVRESLLKHVVRVVYNHNLKKE